MGITISVDAMGGDFAPEIVIDGVALSAVRHGEVRFALYGRQEQILPLVQKHKILEGRVDIIHCDDVIAMNEKPVAALRRGKNSSMWNAIGAVLDGKAKAVISAGNTGALMAIARFRLGMIEGIDRPALASLWPTPYGEAVMLDMGANVEANASQLLEFAMMGAEYARILFEKEKPKLGLLNVGSEQMKGNEVVQVADSYLRESQEALKFDYHGFVEGNDITAGTTDVIITDGFTGNIALKTAEGAAWLIGHFLKSALLSNIWGKIGAWIARKSLNAFKERIDPKRVNGGVFLGLSGLVVKSHGGTNDIGFAAATDLAIDLSKGDIVKSIEENIVALANVNNVVKG